MDSKNNYLYVDDMAVTESMAISEELLEHMPPPKGKVYHGHGIFNIRDYEKLSEVQP